MRQPGARLRMESNYVRRDDAKWLFFTSAGEMLRLSQKCQAVAAFSALTRRRKELQRALLSAPSLKWRLCV